MKVAVLGGGPGGLVTLKYLIQAHQFQPAEPIEVRLFEAGPEIGGTFRQRCYEDCEVIAMVHIKSRHISTTNTSDSKFLPSI